MSWGDKMEKGDLVRIVSKDFKRYKGAYRIEQKYGEIMNSPDGKEVIIYSYKLEGLSMQFYDNEIERVDEGRGEKR